MNVALYVRVSTDAQDLEGQERELRDEALRRKLDVVEVYREKVSGTGREERSEYDRLLVDSSSPSRSWDVLLVWALDRFSRATRFTEAINAVLDLEKRGVKFLSLKEPFLDSPANGEESFARDLLLAVLPVVAKFEAIRRRERTQLAMTQIKKGLRETRSKLPPGRPLRVTPDKLETIVRLRDEGLAWKDVAMRVGLPIGTCRRVAFEDRRARSKT